ncbi:MAG: ATP-binding protein [Tepidisphaeraceae bacterium]
MNLIWNLSRMLLPGSDFRTGNAGYDVLFDDNGEELRYILQVEEGKVTREEVIVKQETMLKRGQTGEGTIYTETEKKMLRFQPPEHELAAVARRDAIQHRFLEPLHQWAKAVRHYSFGASLGKASLGVLVKEGPEANDRDENQVVGIFRRASKEFGAEYVDVLIRDMAELNYRIEHVEVATPENIKFIGPGAPGDLLAVGVREQGVNAMVDQTDMSDGMFSALSLLIQVNYSQMAKRANCILIDDIGEGLDFERSSRLIEILRQKAEQSSFQLVMTTNDQFVMNHVPLEEWSVLQRDGCHVRVRNYTNSREEFEHFKFVGLSNFAFLEMDFVNGPPQEEAVGAHE